MFFNDNRYISLPSMRKSILGFYLKVRACGFLEEMLFFINILQEMCGSIMVTPEVMKEYGVSLPEWIIVREVSDTKKTAVFSKFIGAGESSAIALAMETENALLIVDDRRARQFALGLGLEIIGTLGLIIRAHENGIIHDIDSVVANLREIGDCQLIPMRL